jgi:very-short-patch-repair endonuclease
MNGCPQGSAAAGGSRKTGRVLLDPQSFPGDSAGELEFLLFRQEGVIARRQALRFLSAKAIRHRLASGRWRQAHRAVYVTHTGPITEVGRWWIACLGAGAARPAALGGLSALASLGLRGQRRRPIHVVLPDYRRDTDPPPGVVVRRSRTLTRDDLHPAGAPPCTMPARSMIDAARWADRDEDAVMIIAATFQQRLVGIADVEPVLARLPRISRRRVIADAARDAAGGAESGYEIAFARLCRRARLPEPTRQATRAVAGRKRYRDVYFDEWHVHVEIDGSQHMDVRDWHADMRQHNEVVIAGERLLRFSGWMVRHRPDEVAADVCAALTAAGWRPKR